MMKIRTNTFSYQKKKTNKNLIISLNVEDNEEIPSLSVMLDLARISYFATRVPKVLTGLLLLAAEVYAIDRGFSRKKYSINGWSREFDVSFRVSNANLFQANVERINALLSFLTGDYWSCEFEEAPILEFVDTDDTNGFNSISQVNLFSGGMDSLIGAIDYMEQNNEDNKLFLVSHYDSKMNGPKADQEKIISEFSSHYPNRFIWLGSLGISPTISKELTSRSRSLMFLALAIMVAAYKSGKVFVPENGPVSLNFPLSYSRRAACSTRTTHPIFIGMVRELLEIWNIPVSISNPYEFKTKGEMVRECEDRQYLLNILELSNSCGKRGEHQFMYDNHNASHCGRCMPCMYRKASLVGYKDKTTYGITLEHLFRLHYVNPREKCSNDFFAMLNYLKRLYSDQDIKKELLVMGMNKKNSHFNDYVSLVKRTREELRNLLRLEAPKQILDYVGIK